MSTTVFSKLLDAIRDELALVPLLASGQLRINKTRPTPDGIKHSINIRSASASSAGGGSTNCGRMVDFDVVIEIAARAQTAQELDDPAIAVDALLSAVDARLQVADFSAFGVIEMLDQVDLDWSAAAGQEPVASISHRIAFRMHAAAGFLLSV